jgi:Fe-S cluster assembly ATP-binding protein
MTLEIKNLNVEIENKTVLKDINLDMGKGKVYVLLGPNGSGKTTLSNAILGNPMLKTSGKIFFENSDLTNLKPNEIAKKGIFMSFQNPAEISGVSIPSLLRTSYNSLHEKKISILDFQKLLEKTAENLGLNSDFLERNLEGFSGGEKKKLEIFQLLILNPKFAILDETDSGLDIDSLKTISKGISKFMNKDKTILIITHHTKILEYLKPDKVFIMKQGEIVKEGNSDLIEKIEKEGYKNF